MSSSKNNNKASNANNNTSSKGELIAIRSTPRRDGFDIARFRTAMKQAESVDNPSRTLLYDIYNDIISDPHYIAVSGKRKDAISGLNIVFSDKGKENEAIKELIGKSWFGKMLVDIVESRFWGYSAMWVDLSGGEFHKYKLLPRKHIVPEKSLFLNKQADRDGTNFSLPPYTNYTITAGETDDLGLLLAIIPWVLFKRGDINDWATFNEMFAAPFRKGKYPLHDQLAKKALAEACKDFGSVNWGIIPDVTDLEFIQNETGGSTTAYESFAKFCDKQISKAYLHNTMTTDAEGGNYKGEVHENSEAGVLTSDMKFVLSILNEKFLPLLKMHGFNPGGGKFAVISEEHVCIKDRIDIDEKLDKMIEIPAEYLYEKYGIPIPSTGAKRVERIQPVVAAQKMSANHLDAQSFAEDSDILARIRSFFV